MHEHCSKYGRHFSDRHLTHLAHTVAIQPMQNRRPLLQYQHFQTLVLQSWHLQNQQNTMIHRNLFFQIYNLLIVVDSHLCYHNLIVSHKQ